MIALAILGMIGIAYLSGLTTTSKAVVLSQEYVVAESLAKSQVEHIKSQEYISVANYDPYDPVNRYEIIDVPPHLASVGYALEINPPQIITLAGRSGFELQSTTIVIKLNGKTILTLSSYRVGLAL